MLKISDKLSLPIDAVTSTFAILAIRGVGKTHTASVMAEEMLRAGQPIVAYDPTGAWWGLKSSADGKKPGFGVVVFGGDHADVPLEESAGETIAAVIVEKRISAILDCSLMRKGARVRLMTDFCEALYRLNRQPLHLFLDEAHTVAPQRPMPDIARLLGAVEDIVLQGRRRGLGLTIISQRPALVNTNVRSQCATLIAMRIIGPHDRRAITEWTEVHGTAAETKAMLDSLAKLPKGDAWVWSPVDDIFRRVHFRQRQTFDSSATPTVGGKPLQPQRMAEVDLEKLGVSIKATVERAKADDPKELRKKIAELEKKVTAASAVKPASVEKVVEKVEIPIVSDKAIRVIGDASGILHAASERVDAFGKKLEALLAEIMAIRKQIEAAMHSPPPAKPIQSKTLSTIVAANNGHLAKGELAVLTACAQYRDWITRETISILTGYRRSSRDAYISRLVAKGYAEQQTGRVNATSIGVAALGPNFAPLPTGEALREYWLANLPEGERAILDVLIGTHPHATARSVIDEVTSYKRSSRDAYLQRLKARQLVDFIGRGEVKASDVLFE